MEIRKSNKLHNVRYDIRGPVTTLATKMEQEGASIIKLNTGNPAAFGFKPPQLGDILKDNLQLTGAYSDSKGLIEAREAIAVYEKSKGIPNILIENIFTGNGVSELISMSLRHFLTMATKYLSPPPIILCGQPPPVLRGERWYTINATKPQIGIRICRICARK